MREKMHRSVTLLAIHSGCRANDIWFGALVEKFQKGISGVKYASRAGKRAEEQCRRGLQQEKERLESPGKRQKGARAGEVRKGRKPKTEAPRAGGRWWKDVLKAAHPL
jgi:hypothetical protein